MHGKQFSEKVAFYSSFSNNTIQVDFRFLQTMLSTNSDKFKPQPIVTLPLSEIPNAHYMLEYHNVRGVLVCDPWT